MYATALTLCVGANMYAMEFPFDTQPQCSVFRDSSKKRNNDNNIDNAISKPQVTAREQRLAARNAIREEEEKKKQRLTVSGPASTTQAQPQPEPTICQDMRAAAQMIRQSSANNNFSSAWWNQPRHQDCSVLRSPVPATVVATAQMNPARLVFAANSTSSNNNSLSWGNASALQVELQKAKIALRNAEAVCQQQECSPCLTEADRVAIKARQRVSNLQRQLATLERQ